VPDEYIAAIWAVMYWTSSSGRPGRPGTARKPHHIYQVLTKRHARMRSWVRSWGDRDQRIAWITEAADHGWCDAEDLDTAPIMDAVLPNVWLGVSAENQGTANLRVPALLETPAAIRFVSAEPLLGPVDLTALERRPGGPLIDALAGDVKTRSGEIYAAAPGCVDWVIVGGESGRDARPMHPTWARSLRDQVAKCGGRAFFFKQWGAWGPAPFIVRPWDPRAGWLGTDAELAAAKAHSEAIGATHAYASWAHLYGWQPHEIGHKPWSLERAGVDETQHAPMRRWGTRAAGRELDGRIWDSYPRPES
jgi:protein gp37